MGGLWHEPGAGSLAAYKDFLTLWKDADPYILVRKEANAEYANLQYLERSFLLAYSLAMVDAIRRYHSLRTGRLGSMSAMAIFRQLRYRRLSIPEMLLCTRLTQ